MMIEKEDPEEVTRTNHILTIVLIVFVVKVIIISGLIFMIFNGRKEMIEAKKNKLYQQQLRMMEEEDIEFAPHKSQRSSRRESKAKVGNGKMSSGNFDSEVEDSARDHKYQSRVEQNMNRGLKGDPSPSQVMKQHGQKEPRFKFYKGYKGPEDLVNFDDFFEAGTTS